MKELEQMICTIGSDAIDHQMQMHSNDDPQHLNSEQREEQRIKQRQLQEERDRRERQADLKKREEMMKEWSERDK